MRVPPGRIVRFPNDTLSAVGASRPHKIRPCYEPHHTMSSLFSYDDTDDMSEKTPAGIAPPESLSKNFPSFTQSTRSLSQGIDGYMQPYSLYSAILR